MKLTPWGVVLGGSMVLLGCPLLVDDRLQVVGHEVSESGAAPAAGETADPPTSGGKASPPASGGKASPPAEGGDANLPPEGGAGGAPAVTQCGLPMMVPPPAVCPASCDRCEAGVCIIDCSGGACEKRSLQCPEGLRCRFVCSDDKSCREAQLSCPTKLDCELSCGGNNACVGASLRCSSGSCRTTCANAAGCKELQVVCGTGLCATDCPVGTMLNVTCGPSCSCQACK